MCLCWRDLTDLIFVAQAAACTLRPILDLIVCHTFSQPIWQLWGAKPAWTLCILTKWILILHQCSKKPNVFTSNLDLLFERRFCRATAVTHLCKGVHEIVKTKNDMQTYCISGDKYVCFKIKTSCYLCEIMTREHKYESTVNSVKCLGGWRGIRPLFRNESE